MKVNYILLVFSILLGGLVGYAFQASGMELGRSLFTGLQSVLYLALSMCISFQESSRATVLARTAGITSMVVLVILDIVLTVFNAGNATFYILNSFLLVLSLLLTYKLSTSKV